PLLVELHPPGGHRAEDRPRLRVPRAERGGIAHARRLLRRAERPAARQVLAGDRVQLIDELLRRHHGRGRTARSRVQEERAREDVRRILVREVDKPRLVDVDRRLITASAEEVLDDPEVRVIVELIGGEETARAHVLAAIARGKHVITANKALLASHGDEIFEAAEARGVQVLYEASVGGGIPIIRALRDGLASDRIHEIYGIVNGTSNYILSRMAEEGRPFAEVLAEAQAQGYAEADPALDVDGWDAAH